MSGAEHRGRGGRAAPRRGGGQGRSFRTRSRQAQLKVGFLGRPWKYEGTSTKNKIHIVAHIGLFH